MIVICGKSCSGKDTIIKKLISDYGYKRIITYTTRPILVKNGVTEVDGVDYHFINTTQFLLKYMNNEFLETQFYNAKIQGTDGIVFYGSAIEDYKKADDKTVIILTPNGIRKLKEHHIECTSIYLEVDDETLLNRLNLRGDNQSEILRRFEADKKDFKDIYSLVDYLIDTKELNYDINEIIKKIV